MRGKDSLTFALHPRELVALRSKATEAAAAWPLAGRAQHGERVRRIGMLMTLSAGDPEVEARKPVFEQSLRHLGWTGGCALSTVGDLFICVKDLLIEATHASPSQSLGSTFIFAAFLAQSRPTSQRQSSRRAL